MKRKLTEVRHEYIYVLILILTGCSDEVLLEDQRSGDNAAQVVVETVQFTNEKTRIEAVGTSRALQSITLTPVTSGEVVAVNFRPGQRVESGDILVELDRRDQQLSAELARIRLDDAERLYDRYRRSDGSGAVLPTTLDAARTALETARVQHDQAVAALEDRLITAPFSGYVGISEIDAGDRITPGTVITTLDNRDALLVRFDVPEVLIGAIQPGNRIAINTWNNSVLEAYGDIVDIDSRIDPVTRTFAVRAQVDNTADKLRPGMSFRVSLEIMGGMYAVIPEIAIQWGTEGSYVWTILGDLAHRLPARIIQRQSGQVLVESEIDEGTLIIVEGIQRMYEGAKVRYQFTSGTRPEALSQEGKIKELI